MTSQELRKKFLEFFRVKDHKVVKSSSILSSDPSVLFTTAGMQPFKKFFLGEKSPYGKRVVSIQKCLRTSDIEEVGDKDHLTFIEMLGNFSFGDYYKKEAIKWSLEFLEECGFDKEDLWFTFFKGEGKIPEDEETKEILKGLGISQKRIFSFGKKDNFWGPTGKEGPCGPTAEIHFDLTKENCKKGKKCIPNCDCDRFVEVWNLVFNEYYQDQKGNLKPLKEKGIDTGMGLERLALVSQRKKSVYKTDLFLPLIKEISNYSSFNYSEKKKEFRIISDHVKASVFLAGEGVLPSNVEEGYVLRRLLRRAIRFKKVLKVKEKDFLLSLAQKVIALYAKTYPELSSKKEEILIAIQKEEEKFEKALTRGLKRFKKLLKEKEKIIKGREAFDLYQSYGFPLELIEEIAQEKGLKVDKEGFKKQFEKHKRISRAGAEKKFSGLGIEKVKDKEKRLRMKKLHTATHLLHQALRTVLGKQVKQKGSDINPERLRFDFSHSKKMTDQEIKKVEDLVNEKIEQDLKVEKEEMDCEKAKQEGALFIPNHSYPSKVKVYKIVDSSGKVFSKEICAGPHVEHTGGLGKFKIIKEKSSGAGIRRIKASLENV